MQRGSPVIVVADGLAGAALLTLRQAAVVVDAAVLARVQSSLDTLR